MAGVDPERPELKSAARAVRLTLLGLWSERLLQSYWPFLTIIMAALAALLFGLDRFLPLEAWWLAVVGTVGGAVAALWIGTRRFSAPTLVEARDRVDLTLKGRPLAAIADALALGQNDEASRALWDAHRARMAERAAAARVVEPDLRISRRDPYALRHLAALFLVAALIFGGAMRLGDGGSLVAGGAAAAPGPSWEGWIDPPSYTRRPGLYLADQPEGTLRVPEGSRFMIRLYGDSPVSVDHSFGATPESLTEKTQEFIVEADGTLSIGGSDWQVEIIPDAAPTIAADGPAERAAGGEMRLKFTAKDDYGVIAAEAVMALDLTKVDRRYGLALDPEITEPIAVDLPMPIAGKRDEITGTLAEDFSKHPWAGQSVTLTLTAYDEADQSGSAEPVTVILEGKRFFDPMAAAIAEQRRDLIWNRDNATRVAQVLRATAWKAEDMVPEAGIYLRLKQVIRELEAGFATAPLTDEIRDEVAEALWQIALDIEDGRMADALERLRKAQEKLQQAIKNGASEEEIAELTREMREAMRDYMQQLAEQGQQGDQAQMPQDMQTITSDQLNEMLNKLQELIEQGRQEEAQALLDQLMQMMENMQVTQGQPGQGEGDQAMQGLGDTLRQQQELSDDTFQDLQEGRPGQNRQPPGQEPGQQGQQQPGQQGQPGQDSQQGQNGQGGNQPGGETDGQSLAERQRGLREMLNEQAGRLPGLSGEEGEALRRSLEDAGRAMDRAEDALRDQDFAGALDNQAEAMEALREGMRDLGEMLAERNQGEGGQGDAEGRADNQDRRDPLGREPGTTGRIGTDERMLQGDDVYRRAEELLDEIRRRSSDRDRPQLELDYLQRLLDLF